MEGGSFDESVPTIVDKSRVLEVKPLRSLAPVFLPPPNTPPFACSPPFTTVPQGLSSLFPFNDIQETPQNQPNPNTNTNPNHITQTPARNEPIFAPAPIQSYRTPNATSVNGAAAAVKQLSSNKKNRKYTISAGAEFLINCPSFDRDDGNKESVGYVLASFDSLRRRLSQIEDTKEATIGLRRPDLKAGNILMKKNVRTNLSKRIGVVPGVEVGDIFFFRFELLLVGLHAQSMSGIDYIVVTKEDPVAVSIVSSGGYDDDAEDTDILIYSGQGGSVNKKDKDSGVEDQKLERGNLALEKSLHQANPVRVIRGMKDAVNPLAKVYVYDGLYVIRESWVEKFKTGGGSTFKYKMVRMPGQPSGFGTWKAAQGWKLGFSSPDGLILPDLSAGTEKIPVSLVNNMDDDRAPPYFTYLPTLKYTKSFKLSHPSFGCNCQNACKPDDLNCSCIRKNSGDFPYTANGVLVGRKPLLYECGPTCPCFLNCKNKVSQTGIKVHLEVFKTVDRGWGLRSWDPIRAGTFICEYTGEFVENPKEVQSRDRDSCTYIFDTANTCDKSFKWNYDPGFLDEDIHSDSSEDYNIPSRLIISAKTVGNMARFMNHSCSPNVFWQPIIYEHNSESFLHIGFYAINHIPPLTELTFDYGLTSENRLRRKCSCGSPNCRGFFV